MKHESNPECNYEIKYTDVYTEITMEDKKARQKHRSKYIKVTSTGIIFYLLIFKQLSCLSLHFLCLMPIFLSILSILTFVEKETVKAIKGFGILYSTYYSFNVRKSAVFIPYQNIQKIVINEIIHLIQINYYLQILTTGEFYRKSPTIVIKNNLECLRSLYQALTSSFVEQLD